MYRPGLQMALGLLLLGSSATAEVPGEFSLFAGYWGGDYGTDVDSSTQALTFRYVHGSRFRIRVELPLLRYEPSDAGGDTGPASSTGRGKGPGYAGSHAGLGPGGGPGAPSYGGAVSGVGDLCLAGSYAVAGGGVKLFRLDAGLELKLPTADEDEGLGTGEWDVRASFSGEYRLWSVTAYGGLGWNRFGDPDWVELNDVFDFYAGLEGDALRGRIVVSGWIEGSPEIVPDVGAETLAGLELRSLQRHRWRVAFTAGLGGYEEYGVVLGYSLPSGSRSRGYRGMLR